MSFDLTIQTWPIFERTQDRMDLLADLLRSMDREAFLGITDVNFMQDDGYDCDYDQVAGAICDIAQNPENASEKEDRDFTSSVLPICDEAGRLFVVRVFILADGGLLGNSSESEDYDLAEMIDRLSDVCEIRELCQSWSIEDHKHLTPKSGNSNEQQTV